MLLSPYAPAVCMVVLALLLDGGQLARFRVGGEVS